LLAPGLLDAGHEQFIYVQEANIYVWDVEICYLRHSKQTFSA
jgi:hypothetical protein